MQTKHRSIPMSSETGEKSLNGGKRLGVLVVERLDIRTEHLQT